MKEAFLIAESGKSYLVRDTSKDFHTEYGFIRALELGKAKPGQLLVTNTGAKLSIIPVTFMDLYRRIRRAPQIVPLKDLGAIIAETGINKTTVVLDAGTGSGALAIFIAHLAKKVISYELRPDFAAVALENVQKLGIKNLAIKQKNIYEECAEKNIDVTILDLPEPWLAINSVTPGLKYGGYLISYSPSIPQTMDFVEAARKKGYSIIKVVEIAEREWEIDGRKVRPLPKDIGHSGFIVFCRKINA